jgi:hypothetical protein
VIHPCPRYEPDLSAYLDGETPPARRAEIETHLRACEPCRLALAQLRGVSRALGRWDAHETRYATSTGFRNRVFASLGADDVAPTSGAAWRAAAAVALVAAGATGFALVAPRFASGDDAAYARLAGEVAALKAAVGAREAASPVPGAARPSVESVEVPRVEPLGAVIAEPVADDAGSAPEEPRDVYEQRVDRRFLRDALSSHEDYTRERDKLGLLEEVRKVQESQRTKTAEADRRTAAAPAPSPLATYLGEVRVASGPFAAFENVQVWPIEVSGVRAADPARALPCEKAIAQQVLAVTESMARESVVVENRDAKRAVLVLAGDVLVGGRQDRVAREDALIGPGEQLSIPTYGSGRERKRTSYKSFTSSSGVAPQALRARVAADRALVSGALGQETFDAFVADTVKSLSSPSRLGSLDNLYSNPELVAATDRYVRSFGKRLDAPNVVGFAVTAGSRLLGVEMFGDHATFMDHRARLVRSYVLAAIAMSPDGTRLEGAPPSREAVVAVVASAPRSVFHAGAPSGLGTLAVFRGVDGGPFGYGLLDGARVVHASMFTWVPQDPEPPAGGHAGSHRGSGEAPSGLEGAHGGAARGGSGGDNEGATESK